MKGLSMGFRLSHVPLRLTTGAMILNSGWGKRELDKDTSAYLQQMAARAFPQVREFEPEKFGKLLSAVETGLGVALLAPFIPSRLAGLGLAAFSGGMMAMYFRTPEWTESDGVRPTAEGTPYAKDIWMLAIALALVLDGKNK